MIVIILTYLVRSSLRFTPGSFTDLAPILALAAQVWLAPPGTSSVCLYTGMFVPVLLSNPVTTSPEPGLIFG